MRTTILSAVFLIVGLALGYFIPKAMPGQPAGSEVKTPEARALAAADTRLRGQDEELAALRARIEELEGLVASLRDENRRAMAREAGIREEVEKLNQEWTFSYGSTREAGKFVGTLFRDAAAMREMDPRDPAMAEMGRDLFLKFASLGPILQEIQKIDDNPAEFAEFSSSVLGGALDLDGGKQQEVKAVIERYKAQAIKLDPENPQRADLNTRALEEVRSKLGEDQRALLESLPSGRGGGIMDILEAPPLDGQGWRSRMQRQRAAREGAEAP